jgi:hypothetical protein
VHRPDAFVRLHIESSDAGAERPHACERRDARLLERPICFGRWGPHAQSAATLLFCALSTSKASHRGLEGLSRGDRFVTLARILGGMRPAAELRTQADNRLAGIAFHISVEAAFAPLVRRAVPRLQFGLEPTRP